MGRPEMEEKNPAKLVYPGEEVEVVKDNNSSNNNNPRNSSRPSFMNRKEGFPWNLENLWL